MEIATCSRCTEHPKTLKVPAYAACARRDNFVYFYRSLFHVYHMVENEKRNRQTWTKLLLRAHSWAPRVKYLNT